MILVGCRSHPTFEDPATLPGAGASFVKRLGLAPPFSQVQTSARASLRSMIRGIR